MHLLVRLDDQHTLARLRWRDHCDVERLLTSNKDDLLFCTRDCCVEKIAPKHFLTVCAGRHNDRIILAALTFVHGQRISQRECAPNFGTEELRLAVRGERNVNKRAAALHRLNMRRANVAVEAARSSRLFLRIMVRSFSRTVIWPKRGAAS